jgi:hypothetical protein
MVKLDLNEIKRRNLIRLSAPQQLPYVHPEKEAYVRASEMPCVPFFILLVPSTVFDIIIDPVACSVCCGGSKRLPCIHNRFHDLVCYLRNNGIARCF